jgi:transcriptional regulator with XRE-family HTH domain
VKRRRYKCKPYQPVDRAKFKQARLLSRLTIEAVAALLHVTPRTVSNWERGQVAIPYAAYKLLRVLLAFELPGEAWKGWTIRGDTLWSPEGRGYGAAYLGYQWLTFAMAKNWSEHKQAERDAMAEARQRSAGRLVPVLRLVKV